LAQPLLAQQDAVASPGGSSVAVFMDPQVITMTASGDTVAGQTAERRTGVDRSEERHSMRYRVGAAAFAAIVVSGCLIAWWTFRAPPVRSVDESTLREYAGAYQWRANSFVYLQMWNELTAENALVAFDESGEVRTLYPTGPDRFFSGRSAAIATPIEASVDFERDGTGEVTALTWHRKGAPPRTATRADIDRREDVRFSNEGVQLAGTIIAPTVGERHPAAILVHGSGAATREWTLPFARFLVRHGMAILTYDKRGVGGSAGDWTSASLDDLAGDVVAAFEYLASREDIDGRQIGLLGVSQAGWVMPLAAIRVTDLAFLISVSGPGVPGTETTIDHARAEMAAGGTPPQVAERIVSIMELQYEFVRTGRGWDEYAAARHALAARLGAPPDWFPGTPDDPKWQVIRQAVYDPAPTLRQLQVPVLALFGGRDNNILAAKNEAAWRTALQAGGHPDHTLRIIPNANHLLLEARTGNNSEMASLQRFAPEYYSTVLDWLAARIEGFPRRQ
jgi:alpha-beta hydrolase superfamily lysophospholipase